MAIIKRIQSSFGVDAKYHRITNISINYKEKIVVICVASYLSKEARRERLNPLEEVDIEVPTEDFGLFKDTNVIEYAYEWLKSNVVGFEDAENDTEEVMEEVLDEKEIHEKWNH